MNLRDTYNKIADDWHKDHLLDDWWREGTEKFVSFLQPGATVLDIGCGSGVKSKYLAERGLHVTGFDFAEKMIEIARKEVPEVEFHVLDFSGVENLGRKFDALFAQAALLHVPKKEIQNTICKMGSIIHDGGYFYIAVKHTWEKDEEVVKENDYGYEYERLFSYYTLEEIETYLKNCGFQIVYSDVWKNPAGKPKWVQVIGKKST